MRALSDRDLAEAEELCRAVEHEVLTADELRAVERLAHRRFFVMGGSVRPRRDSPDKAEPVVKSQVCLNNAR